jgi:leucyl-tRNA synthetase
VQTDEPATNLLCQGMVIAETFYPRSGERRQGVVQSGRRRDRARRTRPRPGARLAADGKPVQIGGTEKMSKSKNNGVDPQVMVDKRYGADTVRLFSMFAAPPEQSLDWNESGVEGMARFLRRLWRDVHAHVGRWTIPNSTLGALDATQKTLRRQCTRHPEGRRRLRPPPQLQHRHRRVMELLNHLGSSMTTTPNGPRGAPGGLEAMVLLLNPITPHASHALWQALGHGETLIETCRSRSSTRRPWCAMR